MTNHENHALFDIYAHRILDGLDPDTGTPSPWAPAWVRSMAEAMFPDAGLDEAAVLRAYRAAMSIPSFEDYAVLVREYSGKFPAGARPGRPDDHPDGMSDGRGADAHSKCARRHVTRPERKEYVLTGRSGLDGKVAPAVQDYLASVQVYVPEDLDRLGENDLLRLPGITAGYIADIVPVMREMRPLEQSCRTYKVVFARTGTAEIDAPSMDRAMQLAASLPGNAIAWDDDWSPTDAMEVDPVREDY